MSCIQKPMVVKFEKWHGLGNDFIIVDHLIAPDLARILCDRHRGIGADGVLCVSPGNRAPATMVVLNADGSRPEMCGNGLRCAVGWLASREAMTAPKSEGPGGSTTMARVDVATDAGQKRCDFQRLSEPAGRLIFEVAVDMGRATVGETFVFPAKGAAGETPPPRHFSLVDIGNAHAVCFEPFSDAERQIIGPALERHIAGGVNVEFCQIGDDGAIETIVWERGVGWTQACGTGACAVAAAAVASQLVKADEPIVIRLPGGTLAISIDAPSLRITMRGPAERVFCGEFTAPL